MRCHPAVINSPCTYHGEALTPRSCALKWGGLGPQEALPGAIWY